MSSSQSPPKRPRLSLQIKALTTSPSIRTSRTLAAVVNPRSPTSFNTLTNVYSTAIDRSAATPAPTTAEPITAINMNSKRLLELPRLQISSSIAADRNAHTPYITTQLPETPLTAMPMSPAVATEVKFPFPSTMTATPPLSAGPIDPGTVHSQTFCFSPDDIQRNRMYYGRGDLNIVVTSEDGNAVDGDMDTAIGDSCSEASFTASDNGIDTPFPSDLHLSPPRPQLATSARRRITGPGLMLPGQPAPYVHPRTLHSILRNSPLPHYTAVSPSSPRRQSQRLLEKASRHVMYNSPLTQTITTNRYTKSHIDLLCEEASPFASPSTMSPAADDADRVLDLTLAYSGDETRDGGQTPGPFEEMRRRMAGLGTSSASTSTATTPISPGAGLSGLSNGGIRKRKQAKKDKKRRWVWTLGQDEEEEATLSGAIMALKAAQKAEEAAAAATATTTTSKVESEADPKTPLARHSNELIAALSGKTILHNTSEVSQDVEMQDSDADTADIVTASLEQETDGIGIYTASNAATKPVDARKRKSTPTPYASNSESGGDDDGDVDMQTPTVTLGHHLQGAWFQAAAATAGRMADA